MGEEWVRLYRTLQATIKSDGWRVNLFREETTFRFLLSNEVFNNGNRAPPGIVEAAVENAPLDWFEHREWVWIATSNNVSFVHTLLKKGLRPTNQKRVFRDVRSVEMMRVLLDGGMEIPDETYKYLFEVKDRIDILAYLLARFGPPCTAKQLLYVPRRPEYDNLLLRSFFIPIMLSPILVPRIGGRSALRILTVDMVRLLFTYLNSQTYYDGR